MKITCIAIDDEPLALDILSAYCDKVPFLDLKQTFDSAINAMEYLRENPVDLMFLDIQMEGLTGIQFLQAVKEKPHVIMTTAFDNYAIQGFEFDVDDYLLKPISFARFLRGVNKVYERIQKEQNPADAVQPQTVAAAAAEPGYFFVKTETRMEKVSFDDILYVEGMSDYWRIVTTHRRIMTLMNARGIADVLHEPRFCRVHKSYFVAVDKIDYVERKSIKIGNERIPVSDSYLKHFYELIENNRMS
jgi:two-component system, LytTR family, response regulator